MTAPLTSSNVVLGGHNVQARLVVRLNNAQTDSVTYTLVDAVGSPECEPIQGSIESALAQAKEREVWLLAPAVDVVFHRAELPVTARARLIAALPFALEESLIGDIEALHFAPGRQLSNGEMTVAVVSTELMDAWLSPFLEAGIAPRVLASEVHAIPYAPGTWSLLISNNLALVRTSPQSGFAVELENLGSFLSRGIAEGESPTHLHLYTSEQDNARLSLVRKKFDTLGIALIHHEFKSSAFECLCEGLNDWRGINLLQGSYSPMGTWHRVLFPWRPVAAMAGLVLVLQSMISGVETWQLRSQSEILSTRIESTFREAFPDARRIINPRVQMERRIEELRERTGQGSQAFLALLLKGSGALHAIEGVNLNRLTFSSGNLDLELQVTDLQTLDQLKNRLQREDRVGVEILSASAQSDSVVGRLRIRGVDI